MESYSSLSLKTLKALKTLKTSTKASVFGTVAASLSLIALLNGCAHTIPDLEAFPPTITVNGKTLTLNGVGLRKKFIFNVYTAGLYVEKKSTNPDQLVESADLKVLQLRYHRDIDLQTAIDAFKEGFPKNCRNNCETLKPLLYKFDESVLTESPVVKGQVKTYTISTNELSVSVAGGKNSTQPVSSPDLGQEFLRVFLGAFPASEDLKDGLAGLK